MRAAFLILILFALSGCGGDTPSSISKSTPATPAEANDSTNSATSAASAQTVTVDSPDGVKIVGTLFLSDKPNSPAVLLLHQWQSDRHSYDDFAKQLQAKGFNVLSIDGRGFGESTKNADGTALTTGRSDADVKAMLGDVAAAFQFLSKQKNVDPSRVGIVGASYGSSLALIYAADNPKVAAVALLSPGLNYFGNMPTEPAVKKYGERPLYMVAAEDDKESADAVDKLMKEVNKERSAGKVYATGGHGNTLLGGNPEVAADVEKFLTDGLGNN